MANERQHTRVANEQASGGERKTEIYSAPAANPAPTRNVTDNRKIVGVLLTYTWNPYGQIFEIRQGRTHIGAGMIVGEDRPVEIQCSDQLMSSDHAMILVQDGLFYIEDLASMNGTRVDGQPIPPRRPEPLPSPAEIKAGKTVFHFLRFDVATSAARATPAPQNEETPAAGSRAPTKLV